MFIGVPKSQLIQPPALVCWHGNSRVEIAIPSRTRSSTPRLQGAVEIGCHGCERNHGCERRCKANAISQLVAWLATHALMKARQRDAARGSDIIALTVGAQAQSLYSTQVRVHDRKR